MQKDIEQKAPLEIVEELEFRAKTALEAYLRNVNQLARHTGKPVEELIAEHMQRSSQEDINPHSALTLTHETEKGLLEYRRTPKDSSNGSEKDPCRHSALSPNKEGEIKLTSIEATYLRCLMQNPKGVFPANELDSRTHADIANEPEGTPQGRVRAHMSRLRKKLGDTFTSPIIYTVGDNRGYTLTPPPNFQVIFNGRKNPRISQIS